MIIPISSPRDPRIAAFMQVKERDIVGRKRLFIAEGEVVLRLLIRSSLMETISVLVLEKRLSALEHDLSLLPQQIPIYTASQQIMDAIVGFHIHRGILALGKRLKTPSADQLLAALPPRALVLALVGISNSDNMGALFRNAAAFGVGAIVADATCCDPLYRKAIRVSVGALFSVPFAQLKPGEDLLELMHRHAIIPLALSPAGETLLHKLRRPARAGLILGAEGPGLPAALLARCQSVAIPMVQGFDSLNVATAGGIVLHHLASSCDY